MKKAAKISVKVKPVVKSKLANPKKGELKNIMKRMSGKMC